MPKIPQYTATEAPAVANTPGRYGGSGAGYESAIAVSRQAQKEFGAFANIQFTLQHQVDDLQFTTMEGQYKAGIEEIHQDLEHDPALRQQPGLYENAFVERRAKLINDTLSQPGISDRAKHAFGNYLGTVNEKEFVNARGRGLKLVADSTVAGLDIAEETLSTAAGTVDPFATNDQGENIQKHSLGRYQQLLDDAYKTGFLKEEQYAKRMIGFKQKFLLKNADYYARTDPYAFNDLQTQGAWKEVTDQDALTKIGERANNRIKAIEATNEHVMKDATEKVKQYWLGQANQQIMPDSFAEEVANGKYAPLLPSEFGRVLQHAKDNPVGSASGKRAIDAQRSSFWGAQGAFNDTQTLKDHIRVTRQHVMDMIQSLEGAVSPSAAAGFLEELARFENSIRAEDRTIAAQGRAVESHQWAGEGVQRTRLHEKYQLAEDEYKRQAELVSPYLRRYLPNTQPQDLAEIRQRLAKNPGLDPAAVVTEFFAQKRKNEPPPSQVDKNYDTIMRGINGRR